MQDHLYIVLLLFFVAVSNSCTITCNCNQMKHLKSFFFQWLTIFYLQSLKNASKPKKCLKTMEGTFHVNRAAFHVNCVALMQHSMWIVFCENCVKKSCSHSFRNLFHDTCLGGWRLSFHGEKKYHHRRLIIKIT